MKRIFLVDGDNNIGTGLKGVEMLSSQDAVLIFYRKGLNLTKIKALCAGSRADIQFVESVKGGKNSLDFQIITELGVLVGREEADYAYVISQDKGYAASIAALQARYAATFQEVALRDSIEQCLKLSFLLRAGSCQELRESLYQECGVAQGELLFDHLQSLFQVEAEALAAPAETEDAKPAKVRSRSRTHRGSRGGRKKKQAQAAAAE